MFDTMTMTKTVGAVCGALLVFLLTGFFGEKIYKTAGGEGYGEEAEQAYVIETGAEDAPAEAAAEEVDFATVLASADAAAGEKIFAKCKACHRVDGTNGTGPYLNGIVGKAKAATADFAYSEALLAMAADSWTPDNLNAFLTSPKAYAPGTKMSFAGLPKVEDRANVIAYLSTVP